MRTPRRLASGDPLLRGVNSTILPAAAGSLGVAARIAEPAAVTLAFLAPATGRAAALSAIIVIARTRSGATACAVLPALLGGARMPIGIAEPAAAFAAR